MTEMVEVIGKEIGMMIENSDTEMTGIGTVTDPDKMTTGTGVTVTPRQVCFIRVAPIPQERKQGVKKVTAVTAGSRVNTVMMMTLRRFRGQEISRTGPQQG